MNVRIARWIAWSLVTVHVFLTTVGLALQVITNTTFNNFGIPLLVVMNLAAVMWPIIGALIVAKHPRHPIGWLLCVSLFGAPFDMFAAGYYSYDLAYSGSLPGIAAALVWLKWSAFPFATAAFTLIILLFPDGHLPSPRWRKVGWTAIAALLLYLPLRAVEPGPVDPTTNVFANSPLAVTPALWAYLRPLAWIAFSVLALCYVTALFSLIFRFGRAQEDERQQIKWLAYTAALYWISVPLLLVGVLGSNRFGMWVGLGLGLPAIFGMLISTAFAILKYRLYDIDIIINRTLVYGTLTGLLALTYFVSAVLLERLFRALTGSASQATVVVSTLLILGLFSPLRRRVQAEIDRRFYRRKYDAQKMLTEFSATVRDEVDLQVLSQKLINIVEETMQPEQVSLWLLDSQ